MEFALLGFFTGLSLILAIGAQNVFVIEQGLKKQHIFLVCFICSISDFILIFLGIFLFHYFTQYFTATVELIFNILLIIFLIHFIYSKLKSLNSIVSFNDRVPEISKLNVFIKTLGFTYLNPHVYSDTVFFLGNFSKSFILNQKILFGIGASIASFLFFFTIGYLSKYLSQYAQSLKVWKTINIFIIHIAKPTAIERFIIMIAQFIFIITYAIIYIVSQRTAHRIVGYFEEEAVISYTEYLNELEAGTIPDQPAPEIAINYWNLPLHATLKDVVRVIRDDEAGHRDVNHTFADLINIKKNKETINKSNKEKKESGEEILD